MSEKATARPAVVDTATLIMGDTGTGKTNLLATLFEWTWKTYGKKSLLYSSELGGIGQKMQALVDLGIVWYCRVNMRREIPETYSLASQGYWPAKWDTKTGMIDPDVPMIGPRTTNYTMKCPEGHLLHSVEFEAQLQPKMCPTCKKMFAKASGGVSIEITRQVNSIFKDFGAVGYDSLSAMQDDVLSYQEKHSISGSHGVYKGRSPVTSGTMTYGALDKGHFGFAQMRAPEWIRNSIQIPFLWVYPHFTALESRIEDEGVNAGLPIYAPKIAGKARSGELPRMIGNCLGTQWVAKDKEWRLYVTRYSGEDGLPHAVKNRATSMEAFSEVAPEGYLSDAGEAPYTKFNLGVFYEHLFKALEVEKARTREEYKDAPGPPTGEISGVEARAEGTPGETSASEVRDAPVEVAGVGTATPTGKGPTTASTLVQNTAAKAPQAPTSTINVVKQHLQGQRVMPKPGVQLPPTKPPMTQAPMTAAPQATAPKGAPPPPKPPAKPPITVKK